MKSTRTKPKKSSIGATGQIAEWVRGQAQRIKKYRWKEPYLTMTPDDYIAASQLLLDRQPELVPLTPIGKNFVERHNKTAELKISDVVSPAEKEVLNKTYEIGIKHYGQPEVKYSTSEKAAKVDFWRNFFKMGREVTEKTQERRLEGLEVYNQISKLPFNVDDVVLSGTIQIILAMLNFSIKSSKRTDPNWKPPFQGYHTNVGYPYFRNDRSTQKKTGKTYDDVTRAIAERTTLEDVINYPAIMIGRDQRAGFEYDDKDVTGSINKLKAFKPSKARVVWATSRIANLQFIKIVQPLIEQAKKTNLFTGYNNDEHILSKAKLMNSFAKEKKGLIFGNDWPQFDAHLTVELNAVKDYIYDKLIIDNYGKQLSKAMTLWGSKMPIIYNVEGNSSKKKFFVGGQKSGEIDTNLGGGIKNAFMTIATQLTMDFPYYNRLHWEAIQKNVPSILVMGDDSVTIFKNESHVELFNKTAEKLFGTTLNSNKGEKFFFFLQKRLNNNEFFTTPSPRVISKLIWIERPKGLGPYGWSMANLMKLWAIRNNPEFDDVVRWLAEYDKYKFGTYSPELKRNITKQEFIRYLSNESALQGMSTKERVFDGDPNKESLFYNVKKGSQDNKNGAPTDDFVEFMLNKIKKALSNGKVSKGD